jgi:RNA polymerase sigma-70 factor (ECF subfamily)
MTVALFDSPIESTDIMIAAARAGDHAAIGAIAGSAFRTSVTFYRYTGVSPDHAEDLAADAVESIITKLPTLRSVKKYDAWMWSIIRNRLRDHWRSKRTAGVREPVSPPPMHPDELAVISEEHAAIRVALGTLPLRDRELLWLREVMGLDYRSIGGRVGSSAATVRVACHRARTRLKKAYESADKNTSTIARQPGTIGRQQDV